MKQCQQFGHVTPLYTMYEYWGRRKL